MLGELPLILFVISWYVIQMAFSLLFSTFVELFSSTCIKFMLQLYIVCVCTCTPVHRHLCPLTHTLTPDQRVKDKDNTEHCQLSFVYVCVPSQGQLDVLQRM